MPTRAEGVRVRPMCSLSATRGSEQTGVLVNCRAAGESSLWGCASCAGVFGRQVDRQPPPEPPLEAHLAVGSVVVSPPLKDTNVPP